MLPPIAPAICASSVRSRPLSRSSANRHPAISRSIQAFASRAIGTSPSHRDANGRGASLFDTIDCYLRREQTMWVIASRRRGHDGGDHAAGAGRGRLAARSGPLPGRAGGTPHAGARPRAGGVLAGGSGAARRHGPADAPGLGPPLQRGGPRRPARPAPAGSKAAPHARAGSGAGDRRRAGAGPGPRRRGALAPDRPQGPDRDAVRGPAARALGRQGAAPARLHPPGGPAPAPEGGRGGAGGVQKSFAELVAGALPEHARGKPVEVWFQDEARVGQQGTLTRVCQQGTLTRVWARRGTRPPAPRDRPDAWAYLFGA